MMYYAYWATFTALTVAVINEATATHIMGIGLIGFCTIMAIAINNGPDNYAS